MHTHPVRLEKPDGTQRAVTLLQTACIFNKTCNSGPGASKLRGFPFPQAACSLDSSPPAIRRNKPPDLPTALLEPATGQIVGRETGKQVESAPVWLPSHLT